TGGPTQNFTPGNKDSTASAIKCADECQNVLLPSASFHVNNFIDASSLMGLVASLTCPFILAARTFLARPSEIDLAISNAVVPFSYCRTAPSGNVMLIMLLLVTGYQFQVASVN